MEAGTGSLLSTLLGLLLLSTPGTRGANPALVARITDKGLEYAAKEGLLVLQTELQKITLPDFTGDFKIKHVGHGHYEFHSLEVQNCELRGSSLKPLPDHGLSLAISDSSIGLRGKWKARKIVKLQGSFDLNVNGIAISVNLLLGSDPSGRPTVTASRCTSRIYDVDVDLSGKVGWLLNIFHNQIESKLRKVLENKVCELIQKSVTSDLQPYLQTLPVTAEIDDVLSIDYSLVEAPRATAQMLDVMFKGEIFNRNHRSPPASPTPMMSLPENKCKQMVYFAISNHAFNMASRVYHQAGYLNFTITDDMLPPDSNIRLNTKSFRPFTPQITRRYPNMNLELRGAVVSTPLLNVSPGNLSLAPQMEIEGFVLLPSSTPESVFRLDVVANVFASLTFNNSKVTGMLHPEKAQVKLIESKVGIFNVNLFQAFLNYYLLNTLYPDANSELAKGFPLPLPRNIKLHDLDLQIHKGFLYLGANVQYLRV
uniref:lipopolysaccharide-binding protein n=1 Tax=Myodes glareolus TaxID=447135 RepID=UPI002022173C|nr:lipopolysaccharide-binding protein [Myodes glareolus]